MGRGWVQFVGLIGAVANWGIPAAAISHAISNKDASKIDPRMTSVLTVYSVLFMRWSLAISPPNYPLFLMHVTNIFAQGNQVRRYLA
jgi:hypothetical protein